MRSVPSRRAAALALLAAALPAAAQRAKRPGLDLATAKLVDLTYPFDDRTLYWPTSPSTFQLTVLHHGPTAAGFFYAANSFCTPEHGGTHIDAPIHFAEGGHTIDKIPPERLVGPVVLVDVSAKAAKDPD